MGGVTAGPDRTEPANPSPPSPPTPGGGALAGPPPPAETPPLTQATQAIGAMPGASGESCPNCGAGMSPDQRYCLNCGQRRGDPRLPFMDAVVFMEAMSGPPGGAAAAPPVPPAESKPRFNPSATLIAGIATLILAVGVGVLIGQSGNDSSAPAAAKPTVIQVGGSGGGGEEEAASAEGGTTAAKGNAKKGGAKKASKDKASPKQAKKAEAKAETGSSGTAKSVEEVIKPENGVKIAPPEQKLGGACEEGTAGCEGGKFEGNFFGE